jgi:hypothetical protein
MVNCPVVTESSQTTLFQACHPIMCLPNCAQYQKSRPFCLRLRRAWLIASQWHPDVPKSSLTPIRPVSRGRRIHFATGSARSDLFGVWALSEEQQFTIEPQLVALECRDLPQVSLHYVMSTAHARPSVLRECDDLLRRFDLVD